MGNISKTTGDKFTPHPITETKEEKLSLSKLDVKSAANEVLMAERRPAENLSGRKVTKEKPDETSNIMLTALKNATAPRKI